MILSVLDDDDDDVWVGSLRETDVRDLGVVVVVFVLLLVLLLLLVVVVVGSYVAK